MFKKSIANLICTVLIFLALPFEALHSQSALSTGAPFLLIAPNSRFGGMGETGTAIANDATAMFWNPSGLAFQTKSIEINLTHSQWLAGLGSGDLFYDYVASRKYIKSINGTVGVSLTYLNIGNVLVTDEQGARQPEKDYKAYELAFSLGYATRLGTNWAGGITGRIIYSRLSPNNFNVGNEKGTGTGISASFDLSGMYRPLNGSDFLANKFSMGFNLSNLGPAISYVDAAQADPLPTQMRIGLAYEVIKSEFNSLTLSTDFSKLLVYKSKDGSADPFYKSLFSSWKGGISGIVKSFQTSIGAEYWYGSPQLIALRAGYFYEDPTNGNRNFYTLGAGIRYDSYGFDFSYINTIEEDHPLANTLRFGLLVSF